MFFGEGQLLRSGEATTEEVFTERELFGDTNGIQIDVAVG